MDAVTTIADTRAISRCIVGDGTSESRWRENVRVSALRRKRLDELVPHGSRPVIVSPHPDDEVIGGGGLLVEWAQRANVRPALVIGVTDGEAAYPDSGFWTPRRLADTRSQERLVGLHQLGVKVDVERAGIADGAVSAHESVLESLLMERVLADDVLVTTWEFDGHPDHEACGRVARRVAEARGCVLLQMPIWMWHWASPDDDRIAWETLSRLDIGEHALFRKARALRQHVSQLDPGDGSKPVLAPWATARMLRRFETFFV